MSWVEKKLEQMIDKYGEIPSVFSPYDLIDLSHGVCTTLTTANCDGYSSRGGVLIRQDYIDRKNIRRTR